MLYVSIAQRFGDALPSPVAVRPLRTLRRGNDMQVNVTWRNDNPNTIWNVLARRLGREPTNAEAAAEVRRIMTDVTIDLAERGKLKHQRGRL